LAYAPTCRCIILFFLMLRPPPASPLFPYTPLFRSHVGSPFFSRRQRTRNTRAIGICSCSIRELAFGGKRRARGNVAASPRGDVSDRKSTRLNSSHVESSYAVFCLKKKKDGRAQRLP